MKGCDRSIVFECFTISPLEFLAIDSAGGTFQSLRIGNSFRNFISFYKPSSTIFVHNRIYFQASTVRINTEIALSGSFVLDGSGSTVVVVEDGSESTNPHFSVTHFGDVSGVEMIIDALVSGQPNRCQFMER